MKWWNLILLFLLSATPSLATFSFSLTSATPTSVSSKTQEIQINLAITDLPSASYFRVAIQKQSGDSYFGQIKNHLGNWVDIVSLDGDCHNYFYISDTSASSAAVLVRVGESATAESGQYQLKAHRFTETACSAGEAQNSLSVDLIFPTPIPTQTPVTTSVPPTNTPAPTSPPAPTNTPKSTPTPKPTLTPTPTKISVTPARPAGGVTVTLTPPSVLGEAAEFFSNSSPTPIPVPGSPSTMNNEPSNNFPWPAFILIGLGLTGLFLSVFLFLRSRS